MKLTCIKVLLTAIFLLNQSVINNLQAEENILKRNCPFSCKTLGLSKKNCKDWKIGSVCFVQKNIPAVVSSLKICKSESEAIFIRAACRKNESELSFESLRGSQGLQGANGEKGEKGDSGTQGQQGADGTIKIYGDGSAGDRLITSDTTLDDNNPQYRNFTISQGVTLTIHSGTIIRCSENFINNGTLQILTAPRNSPKFAENGAPPASEPSATDAVAGGPGGIAISSGLAQGLLRPSLLTAGDGSDALPIQATGFGGGTAVIIAAQSVINSTTGMIVANGESAGSLSAGGGAGGLIILGSKQSVQNLGFISARGGNGADLEPDNGNAAYAAGGGGGGGIVHLIAPTVSNSGTIIVTGGTGGAAGSPGSLSSILKYGGRGGGGSGGNGGDGGTANPGSAANGSSSAGENGENGRLILTQADPTAFL